MTKAYKSPKRRRLRGKGLLVVGSIAIASLAGCGDSADEGGPEGPGGADDNGEEMYPIGNLIAPPPLEDEAVVDEPLEQLVEEPPEEPADQEAEAEREPE